MGKLKVNIEHGGGGDHTMVWVVVALVAVVLIAGSAATVTSVLTTIFIWLASIIGGGFVLGFIAWWLTRPYRLARDREFERIRQEREEAYHQKRLDRVRMDAQIRAQENATMAAMVAQAIQAGQQPGWPDSSYTPRTTYKAEVIKREDTS